jgi:hypothetical protein
MIERPFEAVAFHEYPVVGFSLSLTSTRSLAGTVMISPLDVLFTKRVGTDVSEDAGADVPLAAREVVDGVSSAGTLTGVVVAGGIVVVVVGEGAVLSVHPATIIAARMRTQPIAAIT